MSVFAMSKAMADITRSSVSLIEHISAALMSDLIRPARESFVPKFFRNLRLRRQETAAFSAVAIMLVWGGSAAAQAQAGSDRLTPLLDCRRIEDKLARVDCYDAVTDRLAAAQTAGDLVVVDRGKVTELRRQLFGFAAPAMGALFGAADHDRVESIETTLDRAVQQVDGKWRFHLGDGSQWGQVDFDPVRFQNRPGQAVRVRRAALGSYMLTTGNSRAVRVQRY